MSGKTVGRTVGPIILPGQDGTVGPIILHVQDDGEARQDDFPVRGHHPGLCYSMGLSNFQLLGALLGLFRVPLLLLFPLYFQQSNTKILHSTVTGITNVVVAALGTPEAARSLNIAQVANISFVLLIACQDRMLKKAKRLLSGTLNRNELHVFLALLA